MKNNYLILAIIVLLVIGVAVYLNVGRVTNNIPQNPNNAFSTSTANSVKDGITSQINNNTKQEGTASPTLTASKNTGRVVLSITDEAVGLDTVQSILMTINNISVQNSQGDWVSLLKTSKVLDLVSLYRNSYNELVSDTNLLPGTYSKIRISIGNVIVIPKGGLNSLQAKLPLQTLTLDTKIIVEKGKITGISFDFDSPKSLIRTIDGTIIFFPVVFLSTQHNIGMVQLLASNGVQLLNSTTDFTQTFGVDENGIIKVGFAMNQLARFELLGNVIHIIPYDEKSSDIIIPAQSAINIAIQKAYISSALSIQTVTRGSKRVWSIVGVKESSLVTVYLDITTGSVLSVQ